jgi:hypothetical protein
VNFGGRELMVPPLSLGTIKSMQQELASLQSMAGVPSPSQIDTVVGLFHAALVRNYPEMTRAEVEDDVDLGNYSELLSAVMNISGFEKGQPGQGEAQAQRSDPKSGMTSTAP